MRAIIFFLVLITKYVSSYLIISIQDRHPLCHLSHSSSYMSYDTEYTRAKASYNDGMLSLNEELTSYCFHKLLDDFDIILTANPDLINNTKKDTQIVKFNKLYNSDANSKLSIDTLEEFVPSIENFIKNANV